MEKRLFLAVFLSIAFLFGWGALAPRLFPELAKKPAPEAATETVLTPGPATGPTAPATATSPGTTTSTTAPVAAPAPVEPVAVAPVAAASEERVVVDVPLYRAEFSNRGAQLVSFELKKYSVKKGEGPVNLVAPRSATRTDFPFAIMSGDAALNQAVNGSLYEVEQTKQGETTVLRFRWSGGGTSVEKIFRLVPERYLFDFSVEMTSPRSVPYRVVIGPGLRKMLPEEEANRFISSGFGIVQTTDDLEILPREKGDALRTFPGRPVWTGLEDNYFLAVFKPKVGGDATFRAIDVVKGDKEPRRELYAGVNAAGGTVSGSAYFGPKEVTQLDEYGLEGALQFGFFGIIARVLLTALIWVNTWTLNYGWAIVVLTIVIKVLLYPLQHKSMISMKKMQLVQPKANAIKERYKKARTDPDQRQKMNLEMMKLYKDEGINPASGCVPLLLQLPILWAFYTLLSRAIELRGAPWMLWISDLSVKDPYYILPLLMTVSMFVQQWMTPTTADPMQRKIFLAMPIVFGWLFKEFPSGLVLYWFVQNILSILQQWIMNRYWATHPDNLEKGA